ncbi:MAG: PEP-CTERM sorting domain-containing protein [Planctomycetota bacterium]|nr:PEP-CTERM sorting domain-containing protein [Planctomycetota bacterium]
MKFLKIITVTGLILAVSATAGATGVPFNQAYNGPIYGHMANYDSSYLYDWNNGYLADNVTQIVLGTAYNPALVKTVPGTGKGLHANENSWGIFKIDNLYAGAITGADTITQASPTNQLYNNGDNGLEIVGIFYGRQDLNVTFLTPGALGIQQITSNGGTTEIFTQPVNTYDNGAAGSGGRVAAVNNEYATIGYVGDGTNTLLPGAELVIVASDQVGFFPTLGANVAFNTTFTPNGAGSGSGQFDMFLSVTGGTESLLWDTDVFPTPTSLIAGVTADFRLKGSTTPTGVGDWLVSSSDPITGTYVPEPMTMLAVFTGIAGLAGYIRKRRMA